MPVRYPAFIYFIMATAAQCGGKENVLAMFVNRKIEAWSIWSGKQFLFTGMGEDELAEMLEMIERGTNTLYTLKVYKGITDADDITEKTAASGSFNFYIKERSGSGNGEITGTAGAPAKTIGAIQKMLEEKIAERMGDIFDEMENPKKEKKASIEDILQDPDQVKEWLGVIGMVKSIFSGQPLQLAQVANVTKAGDDVVQKEYTAAEQERLIAAINTLQHNDEKILEHLEKLARMSKDSKPMFDNLIKMLDAMP
jgi:hypothetical protein